MNALTITSITNFILAAEVLFLAGMFVQRPKGRFSAAWFWGGTLTLLGLSALIGGIDHGFFETQGLPRYFIQRPNWIVLALMTFFVLMTTAAQFFPRKAMTAFLALGLIQFAADSLAALLIDDFLVVILNYAPVMIFLLVMNFTGLKNGTGSWTMITGILIIFAASAIQSLGVDVFSPLDRNGLYHLVSMIGVLVLYLAGRNLRTVW
jgi:hypothetical protein